MAKNISRKAQALESHWSLANLVKDNWQWFFTALGLGGVNGWFAWLGQAASQAPWHQKLLYSSLIFLLTAFFVTGVFAFISWLRRTRLQRVAVERGIDWSNNTYSPGDFIEGGTHAIADIFGRDKNRSRLTFRNAQIEGPGLAYFAGCETENCRFWSASVMVVIEPKSGAYMGSSAHVFWNCRFESCTFVDTVCIADFGFDPTQVPLFKLEQIKVQGKPVPPIITLESETA